MITNCSVQFAIVRYIAQETSGKTGVLGPTKIYLAVQPAAGQIVVSGTTAATTNTTQPPPLTPVQSPQQQVSIY